MEILRKGRTYFIKLGENIIGLFYVTSIALFKGALIPTHSRWKFQDDSEYLKRLLDSALTEINERTINALLTMELYIREQLGRVKGHTKIKDSANRCMMNKRIRENQ